jgi:hypothetical protein
MRADVEEALRQQVPVAGAVAGVEAVGIDRQLDREDILGVEPVETVEAVEMPDDGAEARLRRHPEFDGRAGRVELPPARRRCSRPVTPSGPHISSVNPATASCRRLFERRIRHHPSLPPSLASTKGSRTPLPDGCRRGRRLLPWHETRGSRGAMRGSRLAATSDTVCLDRKPGRRCVMIVRALEGEIDAIRMSLDDAVSVVRASVVPALRDQRGYGACTCF